MIERPSWLARVLDSQGETAGTGIAVSTELVITCGHVIARPEAAVRVGLPFTGHESEAETVHHVFEPDGAADLAVLKLREPLATDPETALHRAVRFAGRRARLRGFPDRAEPVSPISNVELSGFSRPGWVQINPAGTRGWSVHKGFSGGPVWDDKVEAIIGMVVAKHAHDTGHLLTLDFLTELWPRLAEHIRTPPVLGGAESWHWWPRARGIQHDSDTVWRFRGRHKAIDEIATALSIGRDSAATADGGPNREPDAFTVDSEPGTAKPTSSEPSPSTSRAESVGRRPPGEAGAARSMAGLGPALGQRSVANSRKPLIVTGSPGVGKSAVLARIVTTSHPPWAGRLPTDDTEPKVEPGSVDCAVHAQGKTAFEVAQTIALAAGVHDLADLNQFQATIREAIAERDRFNVVIDAVDEALDTTQAESILTDVITPLAEHPIARIVAGSRRYLGTRQLLSTGYGYDLLDLDEAEYFEAEDLAAYTLATLRLEGEARHDNPYNDPAVAQPLAREIARRSDRNFLVAGLVARCHAIYDTTAIAPESLRFSGSVDDAFRGYLGLLPSFDGIEADRLLTVLAFAEPPGFTAELWALAVEALDGISIHPRRLEAFARTAAASFLIEQTQDESPVFRLFHQALVDVARNGRGNGDKARLKLDESRLTRAFTAKAHELGWAAAPDYLRRSLVVHAARAGLIDELLTEPEFLVHADPGHLISRAVEAGTEQARLNAAVVRAATDYVREKDIRRRRSLLSYNARRFGADALAERLVSADGLAEALHWRPQWVTGNDVDTRIHVTLSGFVKNIHGVVAVQLDNRTILVTCEKSLHGARTYEPDDDPVFKVWDLSSGRQLHPVFHRPEPAVDQRSDGPETELSWFELDGRTLVVTQPGVLNSPHRPIHVSILETAPNLERLCLDGRTSVHLVALLDWNGSQVAITVRRPGTVETWDLTTGERIGAPVYASGWYRRTLFSETVSVLDGHLVMAAIVDDEVELWDLVTGRRIDSRVRMDYGPIRQHACGFVDGRIVVVRFDYYMRAASLWDLRTGELIERSAPGLFNPRLRGLASGLRVSFTETPDGPVVLFQSGRTVVAWDVHANKALAELNLQLVGRSILVCTQDRGRPVAVTDWSDDKLRLWDLGSDMDIDRRRVTFAGSIRDMVTTQIDGREQLVLQVWAGGDALRRWDVSDRRMIEGSMAIVDKSTVAMACVPAETGPTIISVAEGMLRERCLVTGQLLGSLDLAGAGSAVHSVWDIVILDDRLYLVGTTVMDIKWQVVHRDAAGAERGGAPEFTLGRTGGFGDGRRGIPNVACTVMDGRPIVVVDRWHEAILYDLETEEHMATIDVGHYNHATGLNMSALTSCNLAGRPTLFIGTRTGDVHVVDFETRDRVATIPFNDRITALAVLPGNRLVVASGNDLSLFQYHPR